MLERWTVWTQHSRDNKDRSGARTEACTLAECLLSSVVGDIHSEKLVVEMMCNILFGHNPPSNTGRAAEFATQFAVHCSAGVCWSGGLSLQRMQHIQLHH